MIKNIKQFFADIKEMFNIMASCMLRVFADIKETSKYLWYVVRFLIYCIFVYIAFGLMSIASSVGNTIGFLLICAVAIIGVIRTYRAIKNFVTKHFS